MSNLDHTVFIEYDRKDVSVVDHLTARLRDQGIQAYMDAEDMPVVEEWQNVLRTLIDWADTVIFVISPNSMASQWCLWEVEYARRSICASLNKRILPLFFGDALMRRV